MAGAVSTMAEPQAGNATLGLIRRAMAFRVKYRVQDGSGKTKRHLALSLLGVHKLNRGGVYPSPDTVVNLGLKLLGAGLQLGRGQPRGGLRARAAGR